MSVIQLLCPAHKLGLKSNNFFIILQTSQAVVNCFVLGHRCVVGVPPHTCTIHIDPTLLPIVFAAGSSWKVQRDYRTAALSEVGIPLRITLTCLLILTLTSKQ